MKKSVNVKIKVAERWKKEVLWSKNLSPVTLYSGSINEQAGAELGQAQLKLELELSFTWFKFFCIKLIKKKAAGYFDCKYPAEHK